MRRVVQKTVFGQLLTVYLKISQRISEGWSESYTVRFIVKRNLNELLADSATRSDNVDAQADLELHCRHMSEEPFSQGVSQRRHVRRKRC